VKDKSLFNPRPHAPTDEPELVGLFSAIKNPPTQVLVELATPYTPTFDPVELAAKKCPPEFILCPLLLPLDSPYTPD